MKRKTHTGAVTLVLLVIGIPVDWTQSTASQPQVLTSGGAVTIPAGQEFILQLKTPLHTSTIVNGERVESTTTADVKVDEHVVIPNHSQVHATLTQSKRAGLIYGKAAIQLRFDEPQLANGTNLPLSALIIRVGFDPVNPSNAKDSTLKGKAGAGGEIRAIVSGGVHGPMIGVASGSGKGIIYGSAAGVALAAASALLKRGPDLDLPRSTMLEARFDQTLGITESAIPRPVPARAATSSQAGTLIEAEASADPIQPRPRSVRVDGVGSPAGELPPGGKPEQAPSATTPTTTTTGPGPVQSGSHGAVRISVDVRLVLVDALVKDRGGRMIDDLTREDFVIFEDGVQQNLQSFSRDDLPLAVALVVDRSGSVSPYIAELRHVAKRALRQLKAEDQVALFSFASDVERLEDLTTDRERIAASLARMRASGGTDIVNALSASVKYLAKAAPDLRHVVILISDNITARLSQASEEATIRAAMESETVVYSIKTPGQGPPASMPWRSLLLSRAVQKITEETGGEIIDARGTADLEGAMGEVISTLRTRYCLGYYPSKSGDGRFHKIVVRLVDRLGKPGSDYFIHARRGYYSTVVR